MKTHKAQQDQTRARIVQSAVDLMTRQGYDGTTMKDIARAAGIGDATIYKYFPSKDRVLLGFYEQALSAALEDTWATSGLADYSLQEKLQRLTDAVLERLLPEREFVALTRSLLQRSPLLLLAQPMAAQQALKLAVEGFLDQAETAGEIERCSLRGAVAALYADYLMAVLAYWLADESEEFSDTTQLIDLSLGLLVLVLRVGLLERLLQLGGFVLRSQLARLLQHGGGVLQALQWVRETLGAASATAPPRGAPEQAPDPAPDTPAAGAPPPRPRRAAEAGAQASRTSSRKKAP